VQYVAALLAFLPLAWATESMHVVWTGDFVFALLFLVLVLSIGAVLLLLGLIRRGAASRLASLFFLVPPTTALIAWLVFGEALSPLALGGMGLTALGVALVNRG
jgi:drug/metabolite transporter (DMT)-like permease